MAASSVEYIVCWDVKIAAGFMLKNRQASFWSHCSLRKPGAELTSQGDGNQMNIKCINCCKRLLPFFPTILFSINYHTEHKIMIFLSFQISPILSNSLLIQFYSYVIFLILKDSKITEQPIMKQRKE